MENTIENNSVVEIEKQIVISQETSTRINILRFFLMLMVVFFHALSRADGDTSTFLLKANYYFVYSLLDTAVPLFFAISGFIFFAKNDGYVLNLQKKAKSLLVPYLLWPVILLFLFPLFKDFAKALLTGSLSDYSLKNHLLEFFSPKGLFSTYLFADTNVFNPGLGQFWFIRQLILLNLISPVIKYFMKKSPVNLWLFSFVSYIVLSFPFRNAIVYRIVLLPLFYFISGGTLACYFKDFFSLFEKISYTFLSFLTVFLFAVWIVFNVQVQRSLVLVLSILLLKGSKEILRFESLTSKIIVLGKYTFVLFAVHLAPVLSIMSRLFDKILPLEGTLVLFKWLLIGSVDVIFGLTLGYFLDKFLHPVFKVLNGSR